MFIVSCFRSAYVIQKTIRKIWFCYVWDVKKFKIFFLLEHNLLFIYIFPRHIPYRGPLRIPYQTRKYTQGMCGSSCLPLQREKKKKTSSSTSSVTTKYPEINVTPSHPFKKFKIISYKNKHILLL